MLSLAACSSGTTVSDVPQNSTDRFTGTFQSTDNSQNGSVTLNIVETTGTVTGNIIFTANGQTCLSDSSVSGTSTGFNLTLTADQSTQIFTIVTTINEAPTTDANGTTTQGAQISTSTSTSTSGQVGTSTVTNSDGTVTTTTTTESSQSGTLSLQLALNGNNLSGTYVVSGQSCTGQANSGSLNLNS